MPTSSYPKRTEQIDSNLRTSYDAAYLILPWIELQHVKILNVAGPRASKDPSIYNDVFKILGGGNGVGRKTVSHLE